VAINDILPLNDWKPSGAMPLLA